MGSKFQHSFNLVSISTNLPYVFPMKSHEIYFPYQSPAHPLRRLKVRCAVPRPSAPRGFRRNDPPGAAVVGPGEATVPNIWKELNSGQRAWDFFAEKIHIWMVKCEHIGPVNTGIKSSYFQIFPQLKRGIFGAHRCSPSILQTLNLYSFNGSNSSTGCPNHGQYLSSQQWDPRTIWDLWKMSSLGLPLRLPPHLAGSAFWGPETIQMWHILLG